MTVQTSTNRTDAVADGIQTVFPYNYLVLDASHMTVYLDGVLTPSGWTIQNVGNPLGGTVTFAVAPADQVLVSLIRDVPLTQEVDYTEYDSFPAETHESALDLGVMRDQQIDEELNRALTYAPGESPDGGTELAAPVAERAIGYDVSGNLTNLDVGSGGNVVRNPLQETILSDGTFGYAVTLNDPDIGLAGEMRGIWTLDGANDRAVLRGTTDGVTADAALGIDTTRLDVVTDGALAQRVEKSQTLVPDGSLAAPSLGYLDNVSTGFYRAVGPEQLLVTVDAAAIAQFAGAFSRFNSQVQAVNGNVATPGYAFTNGNNFGFYFDQGGSAIWASINGSSRARVDAEGVTALGRVSSVSGGAFLPEFRLRDDSAGLDRKTWSFAVRDDWTTDTLQLDVIDDDLGAQQPGPLAHGNLGIIDPGSVAAVSFEARGTTSPFVLIDMQMPNASGEVNNRSFDIQSSPAIGGIEVSAYDDGGLNKRLANVNAGAFRVADGRMSTRYLGAYAVSGGKIAIPSLFVSGHTYRIVVKGIDVDQVTFLRLQATTSGTPVNTADYYSTSLANSSSGASYAGGNPDSKVELNPSGSLPTGLARTSNLLIDLIPGEVGAPSLEISTNFHSRSGAVPFSHRVHARFEGAAVDGIEILCSPGSLTSGVAHVHALQEAL